MGVDYGGTGALYALGAGTITSLYNSGWPGGGFIGLHLANTPSAGDPWWYYAENINPVGIGVGSSVRAGPLPVAIRERVLPAGVRPPAT